MKRPLTLTRERLRRMPLPLPDGDADKNSRWTVLVIGGSLSLPGAILLSGVAALRVGAGKLQLATVADASTTLGVAVPEAMVVRIPQLRDGEIDGRHSAAVLEHHIERSDAIVIGPGMQSLTAARALLKSATSAMSDTAVLVIDAVAIASLHDSDVKLDALGGRVILTPHSGEMAALLGEERESIEQDMTAAALRACELWKAVIVLKGPECFIAQPDGPMFRYSAGKVGLATSGSGDVLAGIVAGLAARGAPTVHAACWGTFLHGAAGNALSRRVGPIGFLARDLLDEIPGLM